MITQGQRVKTRPEVIVEQRGTALYKSYGMWAVEWDDSSRRTAPGPTTYLCTDCSLVPLSPLEQLAEAAE